MFHLLTHLRPRRRPRRDDLSTVPFSANPTRRDRGRHGGPRTPLPLLPIIAVCAGVALAYVSQTAHATQDTYEVTDLTARQQQLRAEDQRLGDELGRLSSSERIVAAAQQIGMVPAGRWSYVAAAPAQVVTSPQAEVASQPPTHDNALAALIAVLSGAFDGNGGR